MPGAGADGSAALIEVARVLMKQCGEGRPADHVADEEVAVVGTVAFGVSLSALSIAGIGIVGMLDGREHSRVEERVDVRRGAKGEAEFLPGCEGRSVPDEAGVEVWEDPDDALLDLSVDLFFGELFFGNGDVEFDFSYGYRESDLGEPVSFSVVKCDLVGFEGFEARRGNFDLKDSGGKICEGEGASGVCCCDLSGDAGLGFECDLRVRDGAFVDVEDGSANAGGPLGRGGLLGVRGCGDAQEKDALEKPRSQYRGEGSIIFRYFHSVPMLSSVMSGALARRFNMLSRDS